MNKFTAIPIKQPIGQFFICSIPYTLLEEIAIPDALTIVDSGEHLPGYYKLNGSQRIEVTNRRKEIGGYIDSVDSTFPNTIILAANINENGNLLDDDDMDRWYVDFDEKCNSYFLVIPTQKAIARIIDGQHRVRGFKYSQNRPENFDLPCAVFLDLSIPEQASIFATININQRKVDRSLAFDLFAYNLDDELKHSWAPDKLAVFFTRRLSVEDDSPLKGHIKVIARQAKNVYLENDWHVSTSVFIDGICSLISRNPASDRNQLAKFKIEERDRYKILEGVSDNSPLRMFYLENNDLLIYTILLNYFKVVSEKIFNKPELRGYITKTIGVAALFDFLKEICSKSIEHKNISISFFEQFIEPLEGINFNSDRIPANGQGRRKLKLFMLYVNNLLSKEKLSVEELNLFDELLKTKSKS